MLKKLDHMAGGAPARQQVIRRPYHNRQYENATYRALVGADLYLGVPIKPAGLVQAAAMVGSTPQYVNAMRVLIEAGAWLLIDAVLDGHVPLLEAAAGMRKRARLVKAYREATPGDLAGFVDAVGVDNVFDEIVAPSLA